MKCTLWMPAAAVILVTAVVGACSALDDGSSLDGDGSGNAGTGNNGQGNGEPTGGFDPGGGGHGGGGVCTSTDGSNDWDHDGWTVAEGDCNDCDPMVNPGAVEVITDPSDPDAPVVDENCDGQTDEPVPSCDDGLDLTNIDPMNGAGAIDICRQATPGGKDWGVLSARYVTADGVSRTPGQEVGIMEQFGTSPGMRVRRGSRMLVISSGHSRVPGQPGAAGHDSQETWGPGQAPPFFPQDVPACAGDKQIYDDIGLELVMRAPSNATGYSFDFTFYSFEHPEYVCTSYNDQFIALVSPEPPGSINGNISFDTLGNPVSVNIAMFEVCDRSTIGEYALWCYFESLSCPSPPSPYCPQGPGDLAGTGFAGEWGNMGGATGWLVTTAPIGPNEEFTIRFTIWDTGDQILDSTVIMDNFQWIANAGEVGVGTVPAPK